MANTLGNLYSSLKTRVSNFFGNDDDDEKNNFTPVRNQSVNPQRTYTPVRTASVNRGQNFTPVKLNSTVGSNPTASFFSNFNQGYKGFQQQQLAQQQQLNQDKIDFTKNILTRNTPKPEPARVKLKTQEIKPPSFFDKVGQAVKDFSVGIQVSDVDPMSGPSAKNILPNIGRNVFNPATMRSNVGEAILKAPIQMLEGAVPQLFDAKITNIKGETSTVRDILFPNETPDQELTHKIGNLTGKAQREVVIFYALGKLGLNKLLPSLRVGGNLAMREGVSSGLDYVISHPQFGVNALKYLGGQLGFNLTNSILDEKYKDKDPKQFAGELVTDTIFSSLLFAGMESTIGAFGATKFLDNIGFIKNLRNSIQGGVNETIASELNQLHQQKFVNSFNPNAPVNNPEFVAWQHDVQEAYKAALSKGDFGGLMKFMRNIPAAPSSYIAQLGTEVPTNAMVSQAIAASPVTQETAQYLSSVLSSGEAGVTANALSPTEITSPAGIVAPESAAVSPGQITPEAVSTPAVPEITQGATPAPETPQDIIQKTMNETLTQQKTAQETEQLNNIRSIEKAITTTVPTGEVGSKEVITPEMMQNLNKLRLALDENPKLITELDGRSIRALEDAGVEVQGTDGEYKSVIEALKEFRAEVGVVEETTPALQDVNGGVPEQALTDTGTQVVNREPLETGPVANLGNEEIASGVAGTENDELAQVTGQTQDIATTENTSAPVDQTTLGQPAYELPGKTASKDIITSREFPGGKEVRRYPKPILVDPDGRAFMLGSNPKTTHFIDKVINKILNLARPEDSRALVEGVNNLLPSGEKIALPAFTQPITVATRQQAIDAIARLQPGQKIEILNKLKDGKKIIPMISDEQIQTIQNETAEILASPMLAQLEEFVANSVDAGAFKASWKGGIQNTPQQFKDWVNNRSASDIAGVRARQAFDAMDNDKIEAFHKIQQGDKSAFAKQLREYFDSRYEKLKDAGFELGYREDYIPQLWENTQEEVEKVLGDRLSKRPGLTFERFIDDYQEGIEKGLTPRFEKLSDLVGWYESTTNKAIADKKFFDFLSNNELIKPKDKAPRSWVTLDPDRFPAPPGQATGNYKAPEDIAKIVNNYLGPGNEVMRKVAGVFSRMKNVVLSGGVPGTGINAHGFNLLARYTLANKNPVVGLAKGAYYLVNPNAAKANLDKSLDRMEFFIRHGMTASTEEHAFTRAMQEVEGNIFKQSGAKLSDLQQKLFEDPLFAKTVPWMKTQLAEQIYQGAKAKMGDAEAARMAARTVNNLLGGINVDEIARNKDFQNALRIAILAPDWAETQFRVGAGVLKGATTGFKDEQYKTYRHLAAAFLASYAGINILNKAMSGHYMWENESGNEFNLDTGTYTADGKKRYVRAYGTAVDFVRIPFDIASGVLKGNTDVVFKTIKNRLSTPAGTGIALLTNVDYTGQKIRNEDDPISKQIFNTASVVSRMFLPSQVGAGFDYLGGKSAEESIARALELPTRYQGGAYSKTQKEITKMIQDGGATGETVGEINALVKGETLSDAQKKTIARLATQNPAEAKQYIETLKARRSIDDPEGKKTPLDYIKGLFNKGGDGEQTSPGTFTPSEDKAIRDEQKAEINERLKAGMEVSDDELKFAYFGDLLDIPSGGTEKLKAEEELYKKVSGLMTDEDISDEQRNTLLNTISTALEVPRSDIEYYSNANESEAVRFDMISKEVQNMDDEDSVLNFLLGLKKEVNSKALLTSGVVTELYETGLISKDMKTLLGKYRWNPLTGEVELSRSSIDAANKAKKPKNLSIDVPNISTPKLSIPSINVSFKNHNLIPLSTQGSYNPPASLKPNLVSIKSPSSGTISPRIRASAKTLSQLGRL